MQRSAAIIVREYGPWPDVTHVHGVSHDGTRVWIATGEALRALDPASGAELRRLRLPAQAGTAFDGTHLYQLAGPRIQKVDPRTGTVVATIPAPAEGSSGMAWAEGSLWVGQYRNRRIHQVDPETGKVLRTLECQRFVTGVSWVDGELWHGSREQQDSALCRVDPASGELLEQLDLPPGMVVSGLESDGRDTWFCGGAESGRLRAVRRPG
jgi:streptogramin lyase